MAVRGSDPSIPGRKQAATALSRQAADIPRVPSVSFASIRAVSTADEWRQVARAGAQLSAIGADWLEREVHERKTGYLAGQELEIDRKRIELQNQFATDPQGFDNAWTAYTEGKISESEDWAVPHLTKSLGQNGNAAYGSLLNEKRGRDRALDKDRLDSLISQSDSEVIGAAMSGTYYTETGQAKLAKYKAVLASAVTSGFISEEQAEERVLTMTARAGSEVSKSFIRDSYRQNRARGADAFGLALKQAEETFLTSEDPRLNVLDEKQRKAHYDSAVSEIRALEGERKIDLQYARESAKDIHFAIEHGIRPASDVVESVTGQLMQAGGHADAARLRAAAARYDDLANFGRLPLAEQVAAYQGSAGGLPPNAGELASSIKGSAQELGVDPVALATAISYETAGTFSPDIMGGNDLTGDKQGDFQGLIQFSPAMREHFGITKGMSPTDQMVAVTRYLKEAGVTPGMGLLDIYSAINAGRVGRYNASDREGETVRSHVARMEREHGPKAAALLGGGGATDVRLMAGERDLLKGEAKTEWANIQKAFDDGVRPDPASLDLVIRAASLAGDTETLEEIAERMDRFEAAEIAARAPVATQQGAVSELEGQPTLTPGQAAFLRDLRAVSTSTEKALNEDAISLASQRFPDRFGALPELDLSPEQAGAHLGERQRRADFVAETYGKPDVSLLSKADATVISQAIATPNLPPEEKDQPVVPADKAAFDFLAAVPDQYLAPTLRTKEVSDAIAGAVRSKEPGKFNASMAFVNQIWTRAPQEAEKLFGADAINVMQDWQAKLRYYGPQELADELRNRDDPQVVERRKQAAIKAQGLAKDKTIDSLVADLDPGFFTTGPSAPVDPRTRDAALADYTALFSDRYAVSLDETKAHQQAIEKMRLYWGRSEVNQGRLTLYAPENVYPALGGSHDWLKDQLDRDLTAQFGEMPDGYSIVADRTTEAEISAGQPPSYLIVTKNAAGEYDLVRTGTQQKPMRYRWDIGAARTSKEEEFENQRSRVFEGRSIYEGLVIGLNELNPIGSAFASQSNAAQKKRVEGGAVEAVDDAFLSALDQAEKAGMGGTALRLYNEIVQRGRTEPITESDFSGEEQDIFRRLSLTKAGATGKQSGHIDYRDYAKLGVMSQSNAIGGFNFDIQKDGTVLITDKWDFNSKTRTGDGPRNAVFHLLAAFITPYQMAAAVGRERVTPDKGVSVRIVLKPKPGGRS